MNDWKELKKEFYGSGTLVSVEGGVINFAPEASKCIVGGENLSYDEYLEIERKSVSKRRHWFEHCYYESESLGFVYSSDAFIGKISTFTNLKVCFEYIAVSGMYGDGNGFKGKEDHVWMDRSDFKQFRVGDCVAFRATVYKYLKTGKGKAFDYALRNPYDIRKVKDYHLPTDAELRNQAIDSLICEVCMYQDHCNGAMCIANEEWRQEMRRELNSIADATDES